MCVCCNNYIENGTLNILELNEVVVCVCSDAGDHTDPRPQKRASIVSRGLTQTLQIGSGHVRLN